MSSSSLGALGAYLREQRELAQLSLRELSRLTHVSNAYLSQIERGLHEPSLRVLRALASALEDPGGGVGPLRAGGSVRRAWRARHRGERDPPGHAVESGPEGRPDYRLPVLPRPRREPVAPGLPRRSHLPSQIAERDRQQVRSRRGRGPGRRRASTSVPGMSTSARPGPTSRAESVVFAAAIGGLAGAALTSRRGHRATAIGALIGATGLATSEWIARSLQRPGEIPALWQRIATTAALAAPLGWVAEQARAGPIGGRHRDRRPRRPARASARRRSRSGPLLGLRHRPRRRGAPAPDAPGSVVAAGTMLVYRTLSPLLFRDAAGQPAGRTAFLPNSFRSSCRVRPAPATSAPATYADLADPARWSLHRRRARRGHRRLARRPCRTRLRPDDGRPAGPRVLRAHHPFPARHRPGVAALGAARATCCTGTRWPARSVRPTSR